MLRRGSHARAQPLERCGAAGRARAWTLSCFCGLARARSQTLEWFCSGVHGWAQTLEWLGAGLPCLRPSAGVLGAGGECSRMSPRVSGRDHDSSRTSTRVCSLPSRGAPRAEIADSIARDKARRADLVGATPPCCPPRVSRSFERARRPATEGRGLVDEDLEIA